MPWIPKKDALRKFREAAGHTIYTLALRVGISERQIRRLESEEPPSVIFGSNLYALASALGCTKEDLATWTARRPRRSTAENAPTEPPKTRARTQSAVKPKNLSELAELERSLRLREGIEVRPIETTLGSFDLLDAERLSECHTQFGAYENHRFLVVGRIEQHKALSYAAAKILKTETGIGARFELGREIAYDVPLIVGVITTTAEHTLGLLDVARLPSAAAVIARVHVARPKGHWKGFAPTNGQNEPLPFAFVVETVLSELPEIY
jgi:transcriptional regulator with XRE-family HTH domain